MTTKLILIGHGRLGKAIATLAAEDSSLQITDILTRAKKSEGLRLDCDLFLDVSLASALAANLQIALAYKKPIIIGTTGLTPSDRELIAAAALKIPVFYSPNFSLGMALLRKFASQAAKHLKNSHIDLMETHHAQKRDAPSGSALLLSQAIQEFREAPIPIHSLRSGDIVGEHTLYFNTLDERITLSHEAHSRNAFARGALCAVHFLKDRPLGLYGMEDLFL